MADGRSYLAMKRIYSAASLPEAHLLLHQLREQGIQALVFNENAQGGVGELPFTHAYPEVWIDNPEDERRARRIVSEFENGSRTERNRKCSECGEYNPATFEICWHCAAEFRGDNPDNT